MSEPAEKRKRAAFTALEIADQVDAVRDWLAQGLRPNQVRRRCAEEWGLQTRAAESRMQLARQRMVQDLESIDRKEKAAELLEAAAEILQLARETRQLSNALGALGFISKLTRLSD
ncbi:MAG: hypothetical protein RLZZ515_1790 [Cyanobacteriota bacterium]|jgi:hypothetical protein